MMRLIMLTVTMMEEIAVSTISTLICALIVNPTPTPWLTLLLVLGKSRAKQNCVLLKELLFHSMYVLSEELELFEDAC